MQKTLFVNQGLKSEASLRIRFVPRLAKNTLMRLYLDTPEHIIKTRLEIKLKKKDFASQKYDLKYLHLLHITPKIIRITLSSFQNLIAHYHVCCFCSFSHHDYYFEIAK